MTRTIKTAAVIQHLAFEDLGSFEEVLAEMGYAPQFYQAGVDDLNEPMSQADLVVILGGPIGVYETDRYPFLVHELVVLEERLVQNKPTLGICLGAQLMARALGAKVYPGGRKEIGWGELMVSEAGRQSALKNLVGVPVLHWHGDTFDLPHGARLLASSSVYPNQAFQMGSNLLAVQFHPEAMVRTFERWLIGHTGELAAAQIDVPTLRSEALRHGADLEQAGRAMLREWLGQLA